MRFFREVGLKEITDENLAKWKNDGFDIRWKDNTIELWYEDTLEQAA